MPYIPTYKRQVFSNRAPLSSTYKELPKSLIPKFDPKQGKAMLAQFELERRKSRQAIVQSVLGLGQQVFSAISQLQQAHIATKIREAETQARNTFDQLYQQFQYDPEYATFEERFETAGKKLYDDQTKDMLPAVRRAYEQKFEGLKGQYQTKVEGLVLQKDHAHGVASMKWQISSAVEKGDRDMLKRVLFGEDITDRPKQPAASGAPMTVGDWLETPAGGKSRHYGATPEELEAYLEDPDAAVEQYYTPTRVIGGREKELTEEAYRRYLDAHARAYQKDAYLETGEPREAITSTHIPGAVENGYVSREAALQLYEEGLYEMMKQQVTKGLKAAHPEKALQKLRETDESGNFVLAPDLRQEDRDELETSLTADLRELNYRIDKNEQDFRDNSEGHFKNKYFSGTLSWGELLQASKNYEKLDFTSDQNNPTGAIHPNDAAQIFGWMKADADAAKTGDTKQLEAIQDHMESKVLEMIESGTYDHQEIEKVINDYRSGNLISNQGHKNSHMRNNIDNPDEVLAGYLDQIKASTVPPAVKGKIRTAFIKSYNENYWVDGKYGSEINPDRMSKEELDRLYFSLILPHAERHLTELFESIRNPDAQMYQGNTSHTGRMAKDWEELDNFEKAERAIAEGYIDKIPKALMPHMETIIQGVRSKQLEWYDLMVDDSGFKRNWYEGMAAPRKSNYIDDNYRTVVVDENDKEWAVQIVNNSEHWVEYKDEPLNEGSVRYAPDNTMFIYVDGGFHTINELRNKGRIRQRTEYVSSITGQSRPTIYVQSKKAEENTGNPWIPIQY